MRGEADLEPLLRGQPPKRVPPPEAVSRGGDLGDLLDVAQVVDGRRDEGVGLLGRGRGQEAAQLGGRHLVEVEGRRRAVEEVGRDDEVARAAEAVGEQPVLEQLDAVHVRQIQHSFVGSLPRDVERDWV